MKKRIFLALFLVAFITSIASASPVNKVIIEETTLESGENATSSDEPIQDYDKVGFFIEYDETEVVASLNAVITVDISFDGTNWIDASFYDYAGGTTLQTSETITADGWYYCWLDNAESIPHARVAIQDLNTSATDTIDVTVYLTGVK